MIRALLILGFVVACTSANDLKAEGPSMKCDTVSFPGGGLSRCIHPYHPEEICYLGGRGLSCFEKRGQ